MVRSLPLALRIAVIGASLSALPAIAQPAPTGTIGLSDAQKAEILSHNSEASVTDARAGLPTSGQRPAIHGEIGAEIGTHGERGYYGAAAIPLGDHAGATVSFESDRANYGRYR